MIFQPREEPMFVLIYLLLWEKVFKFVDGIFESFFLFITWDKSGHFHF